jgi:hypothetical protein
MEGFISRHSWDTQRMDGVHAQTVQTGPKRSVTPCVYAADRDDGVAKATCCRHEFERVSFEHRTIGGESSELPGGECVLMVAYERIQGAKCPVGLSFPKIPSGGIRTLKQNQGIISCDAWDALPAWDVIR